MKLNFWCHKVYWNSSMPIHLHVMDGCFYTLAVELSGCTQAVWPSEFNTYTLALFRKPLRSPVSK